MQWLTGVPTNRYAECAEDMVKLAHKYASFGAVESGSLLLENRTAQAKGVGTVRRKNAMGVEGEFAIYNLRLEGTGLDANGYLDEYSAAGSQREGPCSVNEVKILLMPDTDF